MNEILFTECYTLIDALIWCLMGSVLGYTFAELKFKKGGIHE